MNTSPRVAGTPARQGSVRRHAALALLACGAAMMIAPAFAGAATAVDDGEATSKITIVQTPSEAQPECLPALLGMTNFVNSTDEYFKLTVVASAPPCDPINATAVIYAMPGDGVAWPQELVEKKDFTIDVAGTTEITFSKDCGPAQFDVVTGATPQTIAPWTEKHGPLLFPVDTGTAQQYWGDAEGCTPETTTTTESTTTTTESTTTTSSTVPVDVLGSTTIKPDLAATSTSTTPGASVSVLAATQTRTATTSGTALALTGSSSGRIALGGAVLVVFGAVLFVISRKRSAQA